MRRNYFFTIQLILMFIYSGHKMKAQEKLTYQRPPEAIEKLLTAQPTPSVGISPDSRYMIILKRPSMPSIEEVSQPELGLAGLRINPQTNGESRTISYNSLIIKDIINDKQQAVLGLPANVQIENVSWSPDAQHIAFTVTTKTGIELWITSLADAQAKRLTEAVLNGMLGDQPYTWLSDSKRLIYKSVLTNRGQVPKENPVPYGPVIQENTGEKAPLRTFQDLLKNEFDENMFMYYGTSQLMSIDLNGNTTPVGESGIIDNVDASPDGNYLFVEIIKRPFSYIVPYYLFPSSAEIWDITGKLVKQIADIPLAENLPKGFGTVREGRRSFAWRSDVPATLYWTETQDGGDLKKKVAVREKVFFLEAPFTAEPTKFAELALRYRGITWGNGDLAMITEWEWANRKTVTHVFSPNKADCKLQVIFNRSYEDKYNDPGSFETIRNQYGRSVLLIENKGRTLFLTGEGASPEGNRPFIDEFDVNTLKTKRLWRSEAPYYEFIVKLIDPKLKIAITRRESNEEAPNYYIRNLKTNKLSQLTKFEDPYPQLKGVSSELTHYERKDGLKLTGKLYLPAGYNKTQGALPVLLWAYPEEFKSADAAGQVSDSPYSYIRLNWASPIFWVTQGYAVLDHPSMPIVGEGDTEPNDTYITQLVSNAEAAINKLAEMGVGDPKRVAVGGHSYGAFMTANLLTHSNLFAAGIARSGAYNRTLTPFGFQAEERTLWEAAEVYKDMSPFMYADKMKTPLLLIHGQADNNSGTFTMQSERYFAALKGHGAVVRMVLLPNESHGYRAEESILHTAWEMTQWLDKYVKNKGS